MDPNFVAAQESRYQQLATEYRESVTRCEASLDQLRAAEREYSLVALELGIEAEIEYASEGIAKAVAALGEKRSRAGGAEIEKLSDREFEVFALIGAGKSSRDGKLRISRAKPSSRSASSCAFSSPRAGAVKPITARTTAASARARAPIRPGAPARYAVIAGFCPLTLNRR